MSIDLPDQSLQTLLEGNRRFVAGMLRHPNQGAYFRATLAKGQKPFAAVLSCIDSRVPPELVFDQGLGDLFTARVAGNIVDPALLGSIEFGIEEFSIPLVVVLGHQRCGAVTATVDAITKGAQQPAGHIGSLMEAIEPAVLVAQSTPGDLVDNAVRANIMLGVEQLRSAQPILSEAVEAGRVRVVGLYYSLDTGTVEVIDAG